MACARAHKGIQVRWQGTTTRLQCTVPLDMASVRVAAHHRGDGDMTGNSHHGSAAASGGATSAQKRGTKADRQHSGKKGRSCSSSTKCRAGHGQTEAAPSACQELKVCASSIGCGNKIRSLQNDRQQMKVSTTRVSRGSCRHNIEQLVGKVGTWKATGSAWVSAERGAGQCPVTA
jgi:hypothetical protein